MDAGTIFTSLDTDGNGSLSMSELHCRLSDFGLGEDQIERVFFALDTNHDGVVDKQEFVDGFSKYQHIVSGGRADAFQCGPCKQWGFQKWKLDRWLDFDGHTISVYKCSGQPPAGATPHFTLQMDTGICIPDPSNNCRFSIDTGTSIVHFKAESATICAAWVAAFKAASVSTHKERIDLIKQNKQFNEKVSGASGDYFLGEMLGSGGFASVKAGIHAETGQRVAAKIMPAASAAEKAHKQEIVNMAALKHPNVVEVLDVVYQAGKKRGQGSIYIMLELMSGGELFSRVVDNGCLDEDEARFFFRQILEGMAYCHTRKLCHRDMKLENLLLDSSGMRVKITDFGFAKNLADGAAETVLGTAVYVAPEVLSGHEYDGFKVDMWACGVVLFAMIAGSYPFDFGYHGGVGPEQKGQNAQLMRALMKADYDLPSDISKPLGDLVSHLIQPDPETRYSAAQALKHPFMLAGGKSGKLECNQRTAEDIDTMIAGFSTQYIETPEGDNPGVWLEKLHAATEDAVQPAPAPGPVDVNFEDDEDEDGF